MAKRGFDLDFSGFLDLAAKIEELGGEENLRKATERALARSRDEVQIEIQKAMNNSRYSFKRGVKGSKGRARKALARISAKPVQWVGSRAIVYTGVDLIEVPEVAILMHGTPHIKPDTQLKKAIQVKGSVRKKISDVQKEEFQKALLLTSTLTMGGGGNG